MILTSIISFIIVLVIVVFVHEFGHFIVARWCGVKVKSFAIGFGKELFGWDDKHKTRWKVCAIPLGGYVELFGQGEAEKEKKKLSAKEKQEHFQYKKLYQRAAIVFAGPAVNFLFAIAIFAATFATIGQPQTPPLSQKSWPDQRHKKLG